MFFSAPVWAMNYRPPYDETIEKYAKNGIKAIELIGMDRSSFESYYTDSEIEKIRSIVRSNGMLISNFNYAAGDIASEDEALMNESLEVFILAAKTASKLGCDFITQVAPYPFSLNDALVFLKGIPLCQYYNFEADLNRDWRGNYETYVKNIEKCISVCDDLGLTLLIEPHPYRYVNSALSFLYLKTFLGDRNIGFNFDTGHMFASGDMVQCAVYQLGSLIKHIHIGDNDTYTNAHWRPGRGKIEWRSFLKALKDVGYDGALSMELNDAPGFTTRTGAGNDAYFSEFNLSCDYLRFEGKKEGIVFDN